MKKLKKLAALLLAGAMAMLLLTACGGSGEDKQAEAKYMEKANQKRSALGMQSLDNDKKLQTKAGTWLDNVVDIKTGKFDLLHSAKVETDKNGKLTVMAVAKCNYGDTLLDKLLESLNFNDNRVNVNMAGKWTKVGVVVKTIQGETYVSVAVEIDPNA